MPSSSSISYDYEWLSVIEKNNLYYRSSNFHILKNSPSTTAETGTDFPVPEVLVHFSGSIETWKTWFTRNLFTPQSTHRVATVVGDVATHPHPPHKHTHSLLLVDSVTINAKTTVHCSPGMGVLEEPYSAKQCNHTGLLGGLVRQLSWAGLAD